MGPRSNRLLGALLALALAPACERIRLLEVADASDPAAAPDAERDDAAAPDAAALLEDAAPSPDLARAPDGADARAPDLAVDPPLEGTRACRPGGPTGGWLGCGAGCGVCPDQTARFDLYLQNHPSCTAAAAACAGAWRVCDQDCPSPTMADVSCRADPGGWKGCVGSGCAIDPAVLAEYPTYRRRNPGCVAAPASGERVGCSVLCPPATEADRRSAEGSPGGWSGCRGTGVWVCLELLDGYPRYFANHPACIPNGTCAGWAGTCNAACPAPGPGDR